MRFLPALIACPFLFRLPLRCGNRISLFVPCELVHGLDCESLPVGLARVKTCHRATRPTEDCFKLRDGCATVRSSRRCDLAHAMRRAWNAGLLAGFAEQVAERFLRQRSPVRTGDERQITTRAGGNRLRKHGEYRKRYCDRVSALEGLDGGDAIADMLPTELHRVASTQASVREHVEPELSAAFRDEASATQAIKRLPELDRRSVRVGFERRFSSQRMAEEYLRHCQLLLGGSLKPAVADPESRRRIHEALTETLDDSDNFRSGGDVIPITLDGSGSPIRAAGCAKVFPEKVNGAKTDRPSYQAAHAARPGRRADRDPARPAGALDP